VASIKPASPVLTRISIMTQPGGRFLAEGFTLKMLVGRAYNVPETRVLGAQGWMESDRYNIEARAEGGNMAPGQMGLMIQGLLEARFQLKAHLETRELPVYELVVARGGSKMKMSEDQTPPVPAAPGVRGAGPAGAPPRGAFNRGNGQLLGTAVPLSFVVNALSGQLGRPVIDKTGLSELFDIDLKWTPGAEQAPGPFGPERGGAPPPLPADGPSIYTAIQEQLGLRLESARGPVEVVVIDRAEKPSEN
jgi:uncharacterized protein (TIGR03435 family)